MTRPVVITEGVIVGPKCGPVAGYRSSYYLKPGMFPPPIQGRWRRRCYFGVVASAWRFFSTPKASRTALLALGEGGAGDGIADGRGGLGSTCFFTSSAPPQAWR